MTEKGFGRLEEIVKKGKIIREDIKNLKRIREIALFICVDSPTRNEGIGIEYEYRQIRVSDNVKKLLEIALKKEMDCLIEKYEKEFEGLDLPW